MSETPIYKRTAYWVDNYGKSGIPDERAVQTFMDCETFEEVNSLRNELIAIADGKFKDEIMTIVLGNNRKVKYGSYDSWAKLMLLWMANYKG